MKTKKRKPARLTPAKREANRRNTNKRQAAMEAAAKRDGFESASEAITAWKNGEAVLVKVKQ